MAQLNAALFSSAKEDWETPKDLFDMLDQEFHFTLDPCASNENAKCRKYFTKQENGLSKDWGGGTQYFAIPHTGELQQENGLRSVMKKRKNRKLW